MKKRALAFVLAAVSLMTGGCKGADQNLIPFLGTWAGQFTVEKVGAGPDTKDDRRRHTLTGYTKIILDQKSYLMHLEGEQQQVDIKGTWTYKGRQLIMSPTKVDIKDERDDGPNPNLKFVPSETFTTAYRQKLTFNLSKDGKELRGITTSVAFLTGTHTFKKD